MSAKLALIIANTEYSDSGLACLSAPGRDAEEFARVLRAPDICAFDDVKILLNQQESIVREEIDEFFDQKRNEDLLVLYFSGHGVRDELGALYLAVKNTNRFRLRSTAIKSDYIREAMDQSRSKRQVLILDCCNSGAFAQGTKAVTGGSVGTASAFEGKGYGRVILTASDSTQFAWEGDKVIGETQNSLFTHFLVKGLDGEADLNGDGQITIDELYDYAYKQIQNVTPKQTPSKWSFKEQGEIILREGIPIENIKPIPLPAEIIDAIESPLPYVREGVVQQLAKLLTGKNLGMARSAREALERMAAEDDSRRVSQAALLVLESTYQAEQLAAQKAEEESSAREKAEVDRKAEEERLAREKAVKEEAEREQAEREAAEKAAHEKSEREAAEKIARELAKRQAAEKAAREKEEREAAEKAAREEARRLEAERIARKQARRDAAGKAVLPQKEQIAKRKFPLPVTIALVIVGVCLLGKGGYELYQCLFPIPTPTWVQETPPPVIEHMGAWVDEVIFTEQDSTDTAISQLQAGDIDIYADDIANPALFQTVKDDPSLSSTTSYSFAYELTLNTVGPRFWDGRLNPFSNQKIREAMNWLIDRYYLVQETFGGLAVPRYLPVCEDSADHERYAETIQSLENQYSYDPVKSNEVIYTEMISMGAYQGSDGRWQFNNQPVVIIMIIRYEDVRESVGDYIASQLESIGFTIDRQYKTRSEAAPIWLGSDPAEGLWHIYTNSWFHATISRDEGSNFGSFYTSLENDWGLWQAYTPSAQFYEVASKLMNSDFQSIDERDVLFTQALELSMEDSAHIWLVDGLSFSPMNTNLQVASDLARGVGGTQLWPYTIQFKGLEGGTVRWAQTSVLVDAWNPVDGSYSSYDQSAILATQDNGVIHDPTTGLVWPQRIERAEVVARNGIPLTKTLDWVDLSYESSIQVPSDAWVDWDASAQRFITAGEKYPQATTANVVSIVYYPDDLFDIVKWHDGSTLSVGDFVMKMIMTFDVGNPHSSIYDEEQEQYVESFLSHFKGVRITSISPLTIETYDDQYQIDAELNVNTWWPNYEYGPGSWHAVAAGVLAESNQDSAFSAAKAEKLGIERMSYINGSSLYILSGYVNQASQDGYIPYSPTMSQYVFSDEARTRWANLQAWYSTHGHFWIGTGPFYLETININEHSLVLLRNNDFPDTSDKWDFLMEP